MPKEITDIKKLLMCENYMKEHYENYGSFDKNEEPFDLSPIGLTMLTWLDENEELLMLKNSDKKNLKLEIKKRKLELV